MNPKQLAAFVSKAPSSPDEMDDELVADDAEHNEEEEEEAAGTDMGALFSLAEQFADEITEEAMQLPPEVLANPELELDPADEEMLKSSL